MILGSQMSEIICLFATNNYGHYEVQRLATEMGITSLTAFEKCTTNPFSSRNLIVSLFPNEYE